MIELIKQNAKHEIEQLLKETRIKKAAICHKYINQLKALNADYDDIQFIHRDLRNYNKYIKK
jgi:hypothetical protein